MTLYIIRHGETEENLQRILQGHMPGTLTENGREQVLRTAEHLAKEDVKFAGIVSSDLKRAMDSAQIIADRLNLPIIPMEILRERDWGQFTGMDISEAMDKYLINGRWTFPEGTAETEAAILERAGKALDELQKRFANQAVIVVTHGQFARNLIASHFNCTHHEVTPLLHAEVRILNIRDEHGQ